MLGLKTIVAPVDFSQQTDIEARTAADIARHFGARLIILHVIPTFAEIQPTDPVAAEAYSREFDSEIEQGIVNAMQSLADRTAPDVDVECVVRRGSPAEKIEEFLTSRAIDLVVMPSAPRGRVRRQLLGSITNGILEKFPYPMLTGIDQVVDAADQKPYRNIACKVEPGENAPEQLRWAKEFAAAYGGALFVVGVLPFLDSVGNTAPLPEHLRKPALDEAEQQLRRLCVEESAAADITVLGGPIDDVLPIFVAGNEIDLIVSSRHRKQDTVGVLGLHTDVMDTVHAVHCPMVLV